MTNKSAVPVPLEDQLCYAIYSAGIAIQRVYKPLLDQLNLTYPQYLALNLLWQDDAQTVGELARKLALESSTLTPILKRLEASGLVERARNPENERQVIITLTEEGKAKRFDAVCLNNSLLKESGQTPEILGRLNKEILKLRDALAGPSAGSAEQS